jgi:hypothetical protein
MDNQFLLSLIVGICVGGQGYGVLMLGKGPGSRPSAFDFTGIALALMYDLMLRIFVILGSFDLAFEMRTKLLMKVDSHCSLWGSYRILPTC